VRKKILLAMRKNWSDADRRQCHHKKFKSIQVPNTILASIAAATMVAEQSNLTAFFKTKSASTSDNFANSRVTVSLSTDDANKMSNPRPRAR
jgi:hypothetical protein